MSVRTTRNQIDLTVDLTEEEPKTSNSRPQTLTLDKGVHIGLGELLKCSLCEAEFGSKDDLYSHMSVHIADFPFKCALCDDRYASRDELLEHMPVHASAMYHTCDVCDAKFTRINALRKHKMKHNKVIHECSTCGKIYHSKRGLACHAVVHNHIKPQSSTTVSVNASDSSYNNIVTPTAEVVYECIVCGEGYTDRTDLRNHMTEHNQSLEQNSVFLNETDINLAGNTQEQENDMIGTNQVIDLTDDVPDGAIDHSEGYTGQIDGQDHSTVLLIEPCESTSSSDDDSNQIGKTSHIVSSSVRISESARHPNESNLYRNNLLNSPTLLTNKVDDNSPAINTASDVIDLTDEVPTQSRMHEYGSDGTVDELIHTGMTPEHKSQLPGVQSSTQESPHKCPICGKTFVSCKSLLEHMTLHTDGSPHQCTVCGKRFTRGPKLSEHMMLHTGERPYKCSICGKGFIRRFRFTEHMTTHSGRLPFECAECEKGFTTNYRLIEHSRIHTGEKPYQCRICGKLFRLKQMQQDHELTHAGARPFKCNVCSKSFLRKGDMKKHTKLHDNGQP